MIVSSTNIYRATNIAIQKRIFETFIAVEITVKSENGEEVSFSALTPHGGDSLPLSFLDVIDCRKEKKE